MPMERSCYATAVVMRQVTTAIAAQTLRTSAMAGRRCMLPYRYRDAPGRMGVSQAISSGVKR